MSLDNRIIPTIQTTISWEQFLALWREALHPFDGQLLGDSPKLIERDAGVSHEAFSFDRDGLYIFETPEANVLDCLCYLKATHAEDVDEAFSEELFLSNYWQNNQTSDDLNVASAKFAASDCYYSISSRYLYEYNMIFLLSLCWAIATACQGYIGVGQTVEEIKFGVYHPDHIMVILASLKASLPH